MSQIEKHLSVLGHRARDLVTNFEGVITSVSFELYGCVQVLINPGLDEKGEAKQQMWLDLNRVVIISDTPVMVAPNFMEGYQAEAKQGCDSKPQMSF